MKHAELSLKNSERKKTLHKVKETKLSIIRNIKAKFFLKSDEKQKSPLFSFCKIK
jgi:hypothetical protein